MLRALTLFQVGYPIGGRVKSPATQGYLFRDAIAVMLDGRELGSRAVYVEMKQREPSS